MYQSNLKLALSNFIVLSHGAIFFTALLFHFYGAFDNANIFSILGPIIPLFGVFTTIIIKDTLRNKFSRARGKKINSQMISVTSLICVFYFFACAATFVLFYVQSITTVDQLSEWIARIEVAFGVGLGLIIDDLFGGEKSA
jgi:hypothetical protein